ncbi:hypothetical protein AWRI1631_154250 [Saccharomyces cerevisiae AWRI1631]|uniref:Uncharacterized protein n=1 Tax=Saccharomyces cerevisiae (strain AWRI1631) TaxID=545124 RepID=B5VSF7_YEAS6|nr:hypothetical protein AWRI1631_154250 [Saccharomyces cerevisiae AWRI1631]
MVGAHLKPRRRVVEKMMKKKQKPHQLLLCQLLPLPKKL